MNLADNLRGDDFNPNAPTFLQFMEQRRREHSGHVRDTDPVPPKIHTPLSKVRQTQALEIAKTQGRRHPTDPHTARRVYTHLRLRVTTPDEYK